MSITVRGAVQGVGFRPAVHRLADSLGLAGWVLNSPSGVRIEIEGERSALDLFLLRLPQERPPRACIQSLEYTLLDPAGYTSFEIRPSDDSGERTALVPPDTATCADCRAELLDPADRRHRYPFINCTHCGPRFTIIASLPYDRPNTTMRNFTMCPTCQAEYEDPRNRRFHAQPNACAGCGPTLSLRNPAGETVSRGEEALRNAAGTIRSGGIVALKGIGGYHLLADAGNESAVRRLRQRKRREEKPFALMVPALEAAQRICEVDPLEARLLGSPEAPIVLLRRKLPVKEIAPSVAPGNPALGVLLPYAPVHILLLLDLDIPVVATSGNLTDEPICIEDSEALCRLHGIADTFLVHDRPILRHVDDSVARVMLGRELLLRRARGYAPLPLRIPDSAPEILAVGAHLKNTVAVARDREVFLSQHLGDLETEEALRAFRRETGAMQALFAVRPAGIVSDRHPDYLSSSYARESGLPVLTVQHHYAHVAACMAENELEGRVLGVSWDGTGYGDDGTVWGGEFLLTDPTGFRRVAALRRFRLPGGEAAVREPRRAALGLLLALHGTAGEDIRELPSLRAFTQTELRTLSRMNATGTNSPSTSSAGRLFDAAASLCGLRQHSSFEGQAAMELEWEADQCDDPCLPYPFGVRPGSPGEPAEADWGPMIEAIENDVGAGTPRRIIARRFHETLSALIVAVARLIGEQRVALTGGCFQNRLLTELTVSALRESGFRPYWHQRVPPNDGGIALGQIYGAVRAGAFARAPHR